MPPSPLPHVTILLATYNGAEFLGAQIGSLARLRGADRIDVIASDDGSTDATFALLAEAAAGWHRGAFHIRRGPGAGFQENFRALILAPRAPASYVAFCDQDDLWDADKLERAAAVLGPPDDPRPRLFCSSTRTLTDSGEIVGTSPIFRRPPAFANALVQSIAGGNTMVFNPAGIGLMAESVRRTGFVSHDWWAYLMITGAGGEVVYDPVPAIDYRQHGGNLVGENNSWAARLTRIRMLGEGRFRRWTDQNLAGLEACRDLLTPEAAARLDRFAGARTGSLMGRLAALRRSGVYRQTVLGQLGLWLACAWGKL